MIHIRVDHNQGNLQREFACGIGELSDGDKYLHESESAAYRLADCPICNPRGPAYLGTPLSELSGRPGHKGYERFCVIAESWGYP